MDTLDCKDIKVLLSGLVDDEVEAATRHLAERHLVDCRGCRDVINEAESLDELIRMDASSMIDPGGLPEGFEGAVLGRTVYQREPKHVGSRWTTWTGWLAAAAAVTLAATIWMSDRRAGLFAVDSRPTGAGLAPEVLPASYTTTDVYRSFTLDENEIPGDLDAGVTVRMTREDSEALYLAAFLLQQIDAGSGLDSATTIHDAVNYEDLLPALAAARPLLAPDDGSMVLIAEAVLTRLATAPVSVGDFGELRETVARYDLARALDRISQKWHGDDSL